MQLFEPIFHALEAGRVRYVAVGGIATVLHGVIRLTRDVDLVVDLEPAEARRAVGVLTALGYAPAVPVPAEAFADPTQRAAWAREKQMVVLSFRDQRGYVAVDLFVAYPMDFEELWNRSVVMMAGETAIRVASLDDLIQLKRTAGRPQDLLDVERLEQIRGMRSR
ncbi:MAG: hypothetical protein H0W67_05285 [Gemmatimonadales bacterium]|nr:hypothetical protein [Gemmatimonadales bacterium]